MSMSVDNNFTLRRFLWETESTIDLEHDRDDAEDAQYLPQLPDVQEVQDTEDDRTLVADRSDASANEMTTTMDRGEQAELAPSSPTLESLPVEPDMLSITGFMPESKLASEPPIADHDPNTTTQHQEQKELKFKSHWRETGISQDRVAKASAQPGADESKSELSEQHDPHGTSLSSDMRLNRTLEIPKKKSRFEVARPALEYRVRPVPEYRVRPVPLEGHGPNDDILKPAPLRTRVRPVQKQKMGQIPRKGRPTFAELVANSKLDQSNTLPADEGVKYDSVVSIPRKIADSNNIETVSIAHIPVTSFETLAEDSIKPNYPTHKEPRHINLSKRARFLDQKKLDVATFLPPSIKGNEIAYINVR